MIKFDPFKSYLISCVSSSFLPLHLIKTKVMKKNLFLSMLMITTVLGAQVPSPYQKGYNAEANLRAISNLKPFSDGAMGFDNRYQGIKGSPMMFDTLLPCAVKVRQIDYYILVDADLNVADNSLVFMHPVTKKLLLLPSTDIEEVTIRHEGKDLLFRTTQNLPFEKGGSENRFCQILLNDPVPFIKIPLKIFTEADYQKAYSPDRRYDEFETRYRYYLMGPDDVFRQVQLNSRSLTGLWPEKKNLVSESFRNRTEKDDEQHVISLLKKF